MCKYVSLLIKRNELNNQMIEKCRKKLKHGSPGLSETLPLVTSQTRRPLSLLCFSYPAASSDPVWAWPRYHETAVQDLLVRGLRWWSVRYLPSPSLRLMKLIFPPAWPTRDQFRYVLTNQRAVSYVLTNQMRVFTCPAASRTPSPGHISTHLTNWGSCTVDTCTAAWLSLSTWSWLGSVSGDRGTTV